MLSKHGEKFFILVLVLSQHVLRQIKRNPLKAGLIACGRYIPRFKCYTTTSDKIKSFASKSLKTVGIVRKSCGRLELTICIAFFLPAFIHQPV